MYFFVILFAALHGCIIAEIRQTAGGNDFCIVDGRPYRNGERIPRENVCHVCLCHQGKAECSWMNCPPAPEGCTEFIVPNYCNPALYVCSIPEHLRSVRNRRSVKRLRRESDTPPTSLDNLNRATGDCNVLGVPYRTGDLMGIATSFCLECRCGQDNMFCSPRCCFRHAGLYENASEREAEVRGPRVPQKHPLHHIFK